MLILPFLLATIAVQASAVAPPLAGAPPPSLTLVQAVEAALAHDPDVAVAEGALMVAGGQRQAARLAFPGNPEVRASVASDAAFAGQGERRETLEIAQQLWSPGQRGSRVKAADAGVAAAQAGLDWARRQASAGAAIAYTQLAIARRREAIVISLSELLTRVNETAGKRQSVGDISEFERNQVQIETAVSLADAARLRSETVLAQEELARRIGQQVDATTQLVDEPKPVEWAALRARGSIADASVRPDVVAANDRLDRATGLVAVQRREKRPRPTLVVGWDSDRSVLSGNDFTGFPFPSDGLKASDMSRQLSIGASIAIPLVDRNRGAITSALGDRSIAEAELLRTRTSAESDVRLLLAQGHLLADADAAIASSSGAADDNLRVAERAFELGQLSLTDLLRERERILRSRLSAQDVRATLLETELRLAAAVGGLDLFGVDTLAQDQPATAPPVSKRGRP